MGANSKQGWCLFGLLVGFPSLVGGLAALSEGQSWLLAILATLAGVALVVISSVGLYRIKPLEHEGMKSNRPAPDVKAKSAAR